MARKTHKDYHRVRTQNRNPQPVADRGPEHPTSKEDVIVDCGWGRLIMAHTFSRPEDIAAALREEQAGRRDIALYASDPHVVLAQAPQSLFLDPSHTFRLWLDSYTPAVAQRRGFTVRLLASVDDAEGISRLYAARHMVPVDPRTIWKRRTSRVLTYVVAEDDRSGEIIGAALGVDHVHAMDDPDDGSSLWSLAVDPQATHPGVGEAVTRFLAEHYKARGRAFMDLSVLHNNKGAIGLYEKLGFQRVPVFAIKRKNAINEPLFTSPTEGDERLNPYARLIVDEARRRGILVDILDADNGYFRLRFGGQSIVCRESLSELTTAIAMSRCQDKRVTHRILDAAGLRVPAQQLATSADENLAFLAEHQSVVVKPIDGEQGEGISVGVTNEDHLESAIEKARQHSGRVILEQYCPGADLRIIVINYRVVAAAVRRPPEVTGNGKATIRELIEKQSRRRQAATGGESHIPLDEETTRCVARSGNALEDVLPAGETIQVRNAANLHTGGTIHDVTSLLHHRLADAAVRAARRLDIPVVGLDFIVESASEPEYVIIEANERPGLANHEPQPTAQRFVDLLFPLSAPRTPNPAGF
ncbi:MAG: N-acetylglutaminylglutamine synthetase [Acidiferrobacteraceae bacterium]